MIVRRSCDSEAILADQGVCFLNFNNSDNNLTIFFAIFGTSKPTVFGTDCDI